MTINKHDLYVSRIIHFLKKERIVQTYSEKDRYIPQQLWKELKRIHVCQKCKKRFSETLEIHHKIPVRNGGTNTKENLMVVCKKCHAILNDEQVIK
jgi:5-methylcytosine-specific restriction endonuclease McrA